jgi:hypothetical protein
MFGLVQAAHEGLQLQSAEVQRRLEAQVVELQAEGKHKAFEIAHLKVGCCPVQPCIPGSYHAPDHVASHYCTLTTE